MTQAPLQAFLDETFETFDEGVLARGREYAREGRVNVRRIEPRMISAVVHGTHPYEVEVMPTPHGVFSGCTCRAYEREGECKHIAALAFSLRAGHRGARREAPPRGVAEERPRLPPVPAVLRDVGSAATFCARLPIFGVAAPSISRMSHYIPFVDWWRMSAASSSDGAHARLADAAVAIEREVEALRAFAPPAVVDDVGTAYADLYDALAHLYVSRRDHARVLTVPPGPLDAGGHPGFALEFQASRWRLVLSERSSRELVAPRTLVCSLAPPSRTTALLEGGGLDEDPADVWDLFALRELLCLLHVKRDAAAAELARALSMPAWEVVLADVTARTARVRADAERQWLFSVGESYGDAIAVSVFAQKLGRRGKPSRCTRASAAMLFHAGSTPLERRIGVLLAASRGYTNESRFDLGTAHAHELFGLLAAHPRVTMARSSRGGKRDPASDPTPRIITGDVVLRLMSDDERGSRGALVPRFFVGDVEVDPSALVRLKTSFCGSRTSDGYLSAFVPPALMPWIAAAAATSATRMSFPREASSRLLESLRPLLAARIAEAPPEILGAEVPFAPRPALRVEWNPPATVRLEVVVSVCASAPLVAAAAGAEVFTFEKDGAPAFVVRDFGRELALVDDLVATIDGVGIPLLWTEHAAVTADVEHAIALARWLEAKPNDLVVEWRRGQPPAVIAIDAISGEASVMRKGGWLVLGGALDVHGTKLTFGEVLDAVRLARRFVEAKPGVFLELSNEASSRLALLSAAAELGGSSDGEVRVHHGFAAAIDEARGAFGPVSGLDVRSLADRLAQAQGGVLAKDAGRTSNAALLEKGTLRPYQREAVRWMLDLAAWAPGCVLADDMGLGKTVQTASVLRARAGLGPQLIVAPASVASNWIAELARFTPSLRTRLLNEESEGGVGEAVANEIVVASYGLVQRRRATFQSLRWATVVIDEAQYVKNMAAQRTGVVRSLERDFTIALTGTPLENHVGELFSVVDAAVPGLLGSEKVFRERFRRPIESQRDAGRLALLARLLAPFILRRTRASVLDDLPPREEITEYIDLSAGERRRYLALRRACEKDLASRQADETRAQLKIAILAALLRLRQLACDVRLVDPSFEGESTKIARTVELVKQIAAEGSRTIVFSQFTTFLEKVRDALAAAGLRVAYLAGETPTTKRRAVVEGFQRGEHDAFCVSLLAGGTGLNLTAASYVIHTDPWWNPAVEEQATSRAHRMGQTRHVTVYRLVARGTIEEAVLAMHASKRALAQAVLEGHGTAVAVGPDELLDLLRFEG